MKSVKIENGYVISSKRFVEKRRKINNMEKMDQIFAHWEPEEDDLIRITYYIDGERTSDCYSFENDFTLYCPPSKNTIIQNSDGIKYYYKNTDKLHRDDGPAIIYNDGIQYWYNDGNIHREDGPAFIDFDGEMAWFVNGKRHRTDGPAVVKADGTMMWYEHGVEYEHGV